MARGVSPPTLTRPPRRAGRGARIAAAIQRQPTLRAREARRRGEDVFGYVSKRAVTDVPGEAITVNVYELDTQRGTKKFEAANEEQARRKAEAYGLEVTGAKKVGTQRLTPTQAYKRVKTAEGRSKIMGAEAAITYGKAFGEEYEIPAEATPVDLGVVGMGFLLPEQVEGLKLLPFYDKEGKGTEQDKLNRCAKEFHALETIELPTGEKILKRSVKAQDGSTIVLGWEDIPSTFQKIAETDGLEAMYAKMGEDTGEIIEKLEDHKTEDGYDLLSANASGVTLDEMRKVGFSEDVIEGVEMLTKLDEYKIEDGYDITTAILKEAITPDELKKAGFEEKDVDDATMRAIGTAPKLIRDILPTSKWQSLEAEFKALPQDKRAWYMNERNAFAQYVPDSPLAEGSFDKLSGEHKQLVLEWYYTHRPAYFRQRAKETGYVALAFVPIAGTIAYWKDLSPAWKAISIATDVLVFVPLLKGATAGARAAKGYTVGARVKGAVVGAGSMALAELTAPADFLASPIVVTKSLGRQLRSAIDTIFHPRKIPLGAAELSYTTARLPVDDVGGAKKATQLRDAVVKSTIQGKSTSATVGGVTLELNRAQLQRVGGAMALHNTPDIRPYLNGAIVQGGKEGSGLFISPNFHSRFAYATAFGDVPEGGVKGGLIIRDQRVLDALRPSGKIYMGTAEIEAVLKPGTILPAPTQVLFTNDIAGNRLTFLVLGKKFTRVQVAQLKLLGSIDTVAEIFKPTMKLSNAQKTIISAMDDIVELARERARLARQLEVAQSAGRIARVSTVRQQLVDVDNRIAKLAERINVARTTVSPTDIIWGQYTEKGVLERWRELHPREVQRTALGRRLYGIEPARIVRAASTPEMMRRWPPAMENRELIYRVPPRVPRVPALYTPVKMPPYVPLQAPMYAPPYAPPYLPPFVPPYVPPRVPTYVPFKTPVRRGRLVTVGGKKRYKLPSGSIAWRQGSLMRKGELRPQWYYIPPPWRQDKPISLGYAPLGAKNIDETTPQKTIQMIGKSKAKVPRSASIDLGVVDIKIGDYGTRIEFAGKGEETVVGHRISDTTTGMSIPATAAIRGKAEKGYLKLAFGTRLRSLVTETYKETIPKKFADKALGQKLGKLTPKDIAREINESRISEQRKAEILKMLPDRVRAQVELWLTVPLEYAPTRGFPKAQYTASPFRRKASRTKKVLTSKEATPSASALR